MRRLAWFSTLFIIPAVLLADSTAYVVSGNGNPTGPGCMSLLPITQDTAGAPVFAPPSSGQIAINPASKQVWVLSTDSSTIYVLAPESGSLLATIVLPGTDESVPVFSPDGRYAYLLAPDFASGFAGLVKIDAQSWKVVQTLAATLTGNVAVASDGSQLFAVTGSAVKIFSSRTLMQVGAIAVGGDDLGEILVSGDTLLVTSDLPPSQNQLNYLDVQTREQTKSVPLPEFGSLIAVSPDATKIYLGVDYASPLSIEILDFATGQVLAMKSLPNSGDAVVGLLSEDGTELIVNGNPILVLDPDTLATVSYLTPLGLPTSTAFLTDNVLVTFYATASTMTLIDQDSAQVSGTFPIGLSSAFAGVSGPTGGVVYVGSSGSGNLVAFDTAVKKTVAAFPSPYSFSAYALARAQLYGNDGFFSGVYDLSTNVFSQLAQPVSNPPATNYFYSIGSAPPNQKTYWAPFEIVSSVSYAYLTGVAVYETEENKVVGVFQTPNGYFVPSVVFSPDSLTAYVSVPAGIALYSTSTLQQIASYNTNSFLALVISPDGFVIYGETEDAIYTVDSATGAAKQLVILPDLGAMALSPDGTTLFVTNSAANSVYLVNTSSGSVVSVAVPFVGSSVVVI